METLEVKTEPKKIPQRLRIEQVSKTFGLLSALEKVSFVVEPGTFHALVGENGAGKSTVAKCIMGFHKTTAGSIILGDKQLKLNNPREAHREGIGMVFQHFMLIENMTVAENLLIARGRMPLFINWRKELANLEEFMNQMPFRLDLKTHVRDLSAGEKQKLEILKQLYLDCNIIILDEPSSALTIEEADKVLGMLKEYVRRGKLSVLIITHKFREVFAFADHVTVLRKGKLAGGGPVEGFTREALAELMIGEVRSHKTIKRQKYASDQVKLRISRLDVRDETGALAVNSLSLAVKKGEIYGIAGVSGNGQKQLIEALAGQRPVEKGSVEVDGLPYTPVRKQMRERAFHCLPEEPLKNACVPDLSVAENMAIRYYDLPPFGVSGIVKSKLIREKANSLIKMYNVKTPSAETSIRHLSGGNVQRAVLARELSSKVEALAIYNPCFGLDFKAIDDIHHQLVDARNRGTAVLLLSEDLEEILKLSDRVGVLFNGAIVYEAPVHEADVKTIGQKMAGN